MIGEKTRNKRHDVSCQILVPLLPYRRTAGNVFSLFSRKNTEFNEIQITDVNGNKKIKVQWIKYECLAVIDVTLMIVLICTFDRV